MTIESVNQNIEQKERVFLNRKAPYILLALEKHHTVREIAKKMDMMPFNIYRILSSFDELGLIESKKVGRKCFINLTEKGKKASSAIKKLCEVLK
jgi:DNA-binding MarR family transcriptional regulator